MRAENYQKMVWKVTPRRPLWKGCFAAFFVGGGICLLGEILRQIYLAAGMEDSLAGFSESVSLIFLSALFTGIGLYDRLARIGGAGALVPITGFANAMTAPVMEYRVEGIVTGIGPKMFSVAGSVIAYGAVASTLYGVVLFIFLRMGATL